MSDGNDNQEDSEAGEDIKKFDTDGEDDDISWDDAKEDLDKQKEMIKEEAQGKKENEDSDDDISWDDAKEDLDKQKEMIKEEAQEKVVEIEKEFPPFAGLKEGGGKGKEKRKGKKASPDNLDLILDVAMQVKIELGRTSMTVKDLLQLGPGSIIELSKLAGEPLDIFVNGKEIARGEVVVINDRFGIRLTDIINPAERVERLK